MFRKANFRLALFYSLLFLFSFWAFSIGLYIWMDRSFGEDYIRQVQQQERLEGEFDQKDIAIATTAGDVALDRLRNILLALNGGLVIVIPAVAWLVTRRTFAPVQRIHNQQKQFVSDVAHELRTPLSIMTGELEVALKKDRTISDYKSVLTSSKQETDRLINLVENLLFLAREDQGKQAVEFEKVDVTDLIGSVIANLQTESTNKKIALHFRPEAEPTFVCGQPSMLRRLFSNIIHNAILYTPAEGNIWVSLSANKQYTQVEVKDTGIGISPEDQEKIFNRFYRVDTSRSQTKGYGLGLAICKSIVELHHGRITVHSALGQGSTFNVMLPMVKS
jgi:signal transduction histidine kinase